MQTKRHTVFFFFFSTTIFLPNSQGKISIKQNIKTCFCDSLSKTKQTDTLNEYLCYKGNYGYKLQLKENYEKISRTRLNDIRWEFEEFEKYSKDTSKNNKNRYLTIKTEETSYILNYVGEKIDSLEITIFNYKDTLYSKLHKGNLVRITKDLCDNPKNEITIKWFSSLNWKDAERGRIVTTMNFIDLTKSSYLVNHPIDMVLTKIKKCIDIGQ